MSTTDFRSTSRSLVTSVALITTNGRHGTNVMSAEWTFQISYNPMRFIIGIHPSDATYDNLLDTGEFGANFLSDDQAILANLGGAYTGKELAKLSSELFKKYPAQKIKPPMISGCFLNAECRVIKDGGSLNLGDHAVFVGEVIHVQHDPIKRPLLYSQRNYWRIGERAERKPLIYVTCTLRDGLLRVDGRLSGIEKLPQNVDVTISPKEEELSIVTNSVPTDESGYFELTGVNVGEFKPDLTEFIVTAKWNDLVGVASTAHPTDYN